MITLKSNMDKYLLGLFQKMPFKMTTPNNRQNRWRLLILSALIITCLSFSFGYAGQAEAQGAKSKMVRIGAILPLTGNAAFLGQEERKGIEAISELLSEQGIQLDIRYEDSRNSAREGIAAYQKLSTFDKVDGIIVAHSGVCAPISEFLSSQGVGQKDYPLTIGTIVASKEITKNNNIFIRAYPSGLDEARAMAIYAGKKLAIPSAAILYQNDDYGLDGRDGFSLESSSFNIKVFRSVPFSKDSSDQRPVVAQAIEGNPSGLYLVGNTPAFAACVRLLREAGYKGYILAAGGMSAEALRQAAGPDAVKNVVFSSTFTEDESLLSLQHYQNFLAKLKDLETTPNLMNVYAGISVEILVDLLKSMPGAKAAEQAQNAVGRVFSTVLGKIEIDSERDAICPVAIKKIHSTSVKNDELLMVYDPRKNKER